MLLSIGSNNVRLQCAFVDTPEVESVIQHIADQQGFPEPFYLPEYKGDDEGGVGASDIKASDLDENFDEAARLIVGTQSGSTSLIQRKMQLGYFHVIAEPVSTCVQEIFERSPRQSPRLVTKL